MRIVGFASPLLRELTLEVPHEAACWFCVIEGIEGTSIASQRISPETNVIGLECDWAVPSAVGVALDYFCGGVLWSLLSLFDLVRCIFTTPSLPMP